jgi:hypothetical protein
MKYPYILDTLTYALFKQGKVEDAIRYQEKAVLSCSVDSAVGKRNLPP